MEVVHAPPNGLAIRDDHVRRLDRLRHLLISVILNDAVHWQREDRKRLIPIRRVDDDFTGRLVVDDCKVDAQHVYFLKICLAWQVGCPDESVEMIKILPYPQIVCGIGEGSTEEEGRKPQSLVGKFFDGKPYCEIPCFLVFCGLAGPMVRLWCGAEKIRAQDLSQRWLTSPSFPTNLQEVRNLNLRRQPVAALNLEEPFLWSELFPRPIFRC